MLGLMLALSLAGIAVGPAMVAFGRSFNRGAAVVDGFTLGAVPALLMLRLVPHVVEGAGPLALLLVLAGFGLLVFADRAWHHGGTRVGEGVVIPALMLHALSDGAGLAMAASAGSRGVGGQLAVALLLHRIPEGLFITTTLLHRHGWRGTILRLGAVALATVVGAVGGRALLTVVPDAVFDCVVALGLGAMLRLSLHSHQPPPSTGGSRSASGIAALAGLAIVLAVPDPDSVLRVAHASELPVATALLPLFVETAPAMVIGLALSAGMQVALPRWTAAWLRVSGALRQALRGVLYGLSSLRCMGDGLAEVRSLLARGTPVAAVVAVAVGTPALEIGGIALSWRMLGAPIAMTRVLLGVGVALATAVAVALSQRDAPFRRVTGDALGRRALLRAPRREPVVFVREGVAVSGALRAAAGRLLDHVAPWYVVGLVLAAVCEAAVHPRWVVSLGRWDIALGALAALPAYLSLHAAIPLVAVLLHKGASVGAGLVFLTLGPATNLAVLGALREGFGRRAMVAYAAVTTGVAITAGVMVDRALPRATVPEVHAMVAHVHHPVEWAFAAGTAGLLTWSLLRVGPRKWFAPLATGSPHDEDHTQHEHR